MKISNKSLEKGMYRHYKHDPRGEANNYTYEVIGVGRDTEDGSLQVIYRPLYKNDFIGEAEYFIRPYEMFIGTVEKDGKVIPRFKRIND